jgi:hypothetical protein
MDELGKLLGGMEPQEAARAIAKAAREVFPLLGEEERREVITEMLGEPGGDKVVGLVHL